MNLKIRISILAALLLSGGVVTAQQTEASAPEQTPPLFQGTAPLRFIVRLVSEAEQIALAEEVKAADLSPVVYVRTVIDTTGRPTAWRYMDRTCQGRDFRDVEPATEATRRVLEQALDSLEAWTPATRGGRPCEAELGLQLRLPVEKIARKQDGDPLLFMGETPDKSFHQWARTHMHYFANAGSSKAEGQLVVRFRVESDGRITILEASDFPDQKLVRDVVRVIRKSEGKWTPRRIDGKPVASEYSYRVYYTGS